jgi:hypothetical protein
VLRAILSAASFAALLSGLVAQPAAAADQPPAPSGGAQSVAQLQQQLTQQQQKLGELTNDVKRAEGVVDEMGRQLDADQTREGQLLQQMQLVARIEYQRPALALSNILQARDLDQLISGVAQARLVADKEQALHAQQEQLRMRDAAARNQASAQLSQVAADRSQAAQIVNQTQSMLQSAQAQAAQSAAAQAVQAQVQTVNQQAQTAAATPGSIQAIIQNAFTPQGQAAVAWGIRIAKCESGYNPDARNPSGAEGLFQFMPSTFANTPPGRAGGSIWDPTANAQAAAWMYSQGRQGEWECN